ncbi:hypothetical protein AQF52_6216 [Streptomyces venezuelae]|uniref:hypothetical protein n=1 Tax=Streptomyces gardneri TaxID=66892 RepID=UPI0006BC322C|nr:hypothetical protein [Streptomyces gardneri]ALO11809.1 hypothetical protein AQF52_6216 [Streptomyces venezuelae]QPK48671.1 hypothetical protein H4W23_31215 [Streptomyces gardneri]WRK40148.1 hypothetical protein U0M97_31370 [Streptomyces venezuelae]CUM37635.1 hypothetical protein BN2537_4235 [Streptomyces venezuelae]
MDLTDFGARPTPEKTISADGPTEALFVIVADLRLDHPQVRGHHAGRVLSKAVPERSRSQPITLLSLKGLHLASEA